MYVGTFNHSEKLRDKHVTVTNKNLEIYGACRHKTTSHQFFLSNDDPVFNLWKGYAINGLFKYYELKPSTVAFEY